MSEWDKIWQNWNPEYKSVDYREDWIRSVKAEGDELQARLFVIDKMLQSTKTGDAVLILSKVKEIVTKWENGKLDAIESILEIAVLIEPEPEATISPVEETKQKTPP